MLGKCPHESLRRALVGDAVHREARGAKAVAEQVLPALHRLRAFVADDYLPAAPPDGAP